MANHWVIAAQGSCAIPTHFPPKGPGGIKSLLVGGRSAPLVMPWILVPPKNNEGPRWPVLVRSIKLTRGPSGVSLSGDTET